jgi:hypothetical protein
MGCAVSAVDLAEFMRDRVAAAFAAENTRRQEDRDPTRLTMSGLGGCTRRNAYAVAGVPASDVHPPEQARQALLGTGVHDWYLPALARAITEANGAVCDVEKRVALHAAGIEIVGHLDLAYLGVIVDLKTVREHRLHGVRRRAERGAFDEHQLQVGGYGLAEYQAGRPVENLVYLYMDRTTGEVEPVVQPFDVAAGLAVVDRVTTIVRFAERDPDAAPREARGPGVSLACDRCPWLRRCWGPDARPGETGPQTQLAETPEGLIEVLRLYHAAVGVTSQAAADKDFAKLVLSCTKPGQYGPFNLTRGRPAEIDDVRAMKDVLTRLGVDIPKTTKAGNTSVKLAGPAESRQ